MGDNVEIEANLQNTGLLTSIIIIVEEENLLFDTLSCSAKASDQFCGCSEIYNL